VRGTSSGRRTPIARFGPRGENSLRDVFAAATLAALLVAGLAAQSLSAARLDRGPRIRAVRAKADAFVSGAKPATNYGRVAELRVDAAPRVRAYMRFDVNVKSGDVQHVSVLLWSRTRSHAGYQVRLVEDTWREKQITFENAPPLSLDYVSSGPLKAGAWKAVDITMLTDETSGDDDYVSLALTTPSSKGLHFASREAGLHGPRLVVERGGRDGSPPTGPTGP
jgi:hypothetical protein